MQVASGLAYLHDQKIVYYDLKSPNILVFQFPSADDSLLATQGQGFTDQCATPSPKNIAHPGTSACSVIFGWIQEILNLSSTQRNISCGEPRRGAFSILDNT